MMRRHRRLPCISTRLGIAATLAAGAFIPLTALAQSVGTATDLDPLALGDIARASRMLATGNPQGAADQLAASAPDFASFSPAMRAKWLGIEGSALYEREDPGCIDVLRRLAAEFPTYPEATQAILTIGDWHWHHAEWQEALADYSEINLNMLPTAQKELYTYRKALAYIQCGVPENALPLLASLRGTKEFDRAARYYTAYCRYLQKDYDTAYTMMEEVAGEIGGYDSSASASPSATTGASARGRKNTAAPSTRPTTSGVQSDGIEPLYYMAQIEYLRGDYPKVISHAATLLARHPVDRLVPELQRVTGLSQFKQGDLDAARGHLEAYVSQTDSPTDDAIYALAAAQYADGDLDFAAKNLQQLTDLNNDLSQGAYLYLGQIAERQGDMNAAAMAFEKAARMAYDPNVAETAFYNYIVASSKGGKVPFASSIGMLEEFLRTYPQSQYSSAVEESLAAAYFHEQDYSRALASINRVKNPSKTTLATKQKILYQLGVSEISAGNAKGAVAHLREAAEMRSSDAVLASESRLWLGEALYRLGDFKGASEAYREALKGSLSGSNSILARYGLAYAQFQLQQWKGAEVDFAKVSESSKASPAVRADAVIREADCLHYLGQHSKAAAKYAEAMKEGSGDSDYAAFRHAVVAGLVSGTDAKLRELDAFLSQRPGSQWTSEALLEAGNTWAALDRPDKAAPYFQRLKAEYPKAKNTRTAALSLALAYMKQGDRAMAEEAYRDVIRQWPTSEEAALANEDLRKICAADGRLMEYAQFLSGIKGAPQIDPDEMDAITFEAAETAYADNPEATRLLEDYIRQYPDGRYLANALMDLAEAASDAGNADKALSYLDQLLWTREDSGQAPGALYLKASILEDNGENAKALDSYLLLERRGGTEFAPEAVSGVMRTTSDADQRATYARRLLAMGGVDTADAEEARFYEASGLLHGANPTSGEKSLKDLAENPNTLSGAMAAVELGEWYLKKGDTKDALKVLEEFTDAGSPHAYWLAKGFITLADAYHADRRDHLAVEYLKSLRDNYPGEEPDIRNAITNKISQYSK